jgi:hypothetical protein
MRPIRRIREALGFTNEGTNMHIDRTRTIEARTRTLSRRMQRRMRITERFLAFAFPADLSAFAPAQEG